MPRNPVAPQQVSHAIRRAQPVPAAGDLTNPRKDAVFYLNGAGKGRASTTWSSEGVIPGSSRVPASMGKNDDAQPARACRALDEAAMPYWTADERL